MLGGLIEVALPWPGALPAWQGLTTGVLLLLGFALPPLISLGQVPMLRVLRRELGVPQGSGAIGYALGLAVIFPDLATRFVKGTGGIETKQSFGDVQLHIEWMAPSPAVGTSQDRGNSGVFFGAGRYEVQVLDSYQAATYPDGQAGALYGQFPPLVNPTRPPGEWQAYDIVFEMPRFDASGALLKRARATVFLNGVLVQNAKELIGPHVLARLPAHDAAAIRGRGFFPHLIATPFHSGLREAFGFAIAACLVAALASWSRGGRVVRPEEHAREQVVD